MIHGMHKLVGSNFFWSGAPTFFGVGLPLFHSGTPTFCQMGVLNFCFQNPSESSDYLFRLKTDKYVCFSHSLSYFDQRQKG